MISMPITDTYGIVILEKDIFVPYFVFTKSVCIFPYRDCALLCKIYNFNE